MRDLYEARALQMHLARCSDPPAIVREVRPPPDREIEEQKPPQHFPWQYLGSNQVGAGVGGPTSVTVNAGVADDTSYVLVVPSAYITLTRAPAALPGIEVYAADNSETIANQMIMASLSGAWDGIRPFLPLPKAIIDIIFHEDDALRTYEVATFFIRDR